MVEATAISGPAHVYRTSCDSRAIELPTTLTMDNILEPFFFASLNANKVSIVSPDWLIIIVKFFSLINGSRYLNSEATSTSTGILHSFSIIYLPTTPAWYAVPQATI